MPSLRDFGGAYDFPPALKRWAIYRNAPPGLIAATLNLTGHT